MTKVGIFTDGRHRVPPDDVLGLERVLNHLQSLTAPPSIEDVARSPVE